MVKASGWNLRRYQKLLSWDLGMALYDVYLCVFFFSRFDRRAALYDCLCNIFIQVTQEDFCYFGSLCIVHSPTYGDAHGLEKLRFWTTGN